LQLDEGLKSLATRQKFIKTADHLELGWATVEFYQGDPLASDSDDEKDPGRAEKEARKEVERQSAKRRKGKQSAMKRPRPQSSWPDQGAGASAQETAPGVNSVMVWPRLSRMISGPPGPCWRCSAYGHLAASCAASSNRNVRVVDVTHAGSHAQ